MYRIFNKFFRIMINMKSFIIHGEHGEHYLENCLGINGVFLGIGISKRGFTKHLDFHVTIGNTSEISRIFVFNFVKYDFNLLESHNGFQNQHKSFTELTTE